MTSAEHYAEAERCIDRAAEAYEFPESVAQLLKEAHVHAMLALFDGVREIGDQLDLLPRRPGALSSSRGRPVTADDAVARAAADLAELFALAQPPPTVYPAHWPPHETVHSPSCERCCLEDDWTNAHLDCDCLNQEWERHDVGSPAVPDLQWACSSCLKAQGRAFMGVTR